MKTKSLLILLERARVIMRRALNCVVNDLALPAYLVEGIMVDLLCEVRAQKNAELMAELEKLAAEQSEPSPIQPSESEASPTTAESEA